jgi:hypothetical protein
VVHSLIHPLAAAEITWDQAPGYPMPASPALPAEATRRTPCASAKFTAASTSGSATLLPQLLFTTSGALPSSSRLSTP